MIRDEINFGDDINDLNLYYDPPNPSYEHPIEYRGWNIYKWTGWKGYWGIRGDLDIKKMTCTSCKKVIDRGDIYYSSQCKVEIYHSECKPGYNGEVCGQWLAVKGASFGRKGFVDTTDCKHAYASAPGGEGLFNRGGKFDISTDDPVTYYTPIETLLELRTEAFERLKAVIDVFADTR